MHAWPPNQSNPIIISEWLNEVITTLFFQLLFLDKSCIEFHSQKSFLFFYIILRSSEYFIFPKLLIILCWLLLVRSDGIELCKESINCRILQFLLMWRFFFNRFICNRSISFHFFFVHSFNLCNIDNSFFYSLYCGQYFIEITYLYYFLNLFLWPRTEKY